MTTPSVSIKMKDISAGKRYWQKTYVPPQLTLLIFASSAMFFALATPFLNILSSLANQTPAVRFSGALIFGLAFVILFHVIITLGNFLVVKNGSYYSLDTDVSRLSDLSDAQSILWRKVKKELTPVELENFKGVLPSFKGSIKELMEVSKTV